MTKIKYTPEQKIRYKKYAIRFGVCVLLFMGIIIAVDYDCKVNPDKIAKIPLLKKLVAEPPEVQQAIFTDLLNKKIHKNASFSKFDKNETVSLFIEINPNGTVKNSEISYSSENKLFEKQVFDTIKKSEPFESLTDKMKANGDKIFYTFDSKDFISDKK
jgi:hypothetical protein